MKFEKSENTGQKKLYSGLFEGVVEKINPTQKELAEYLGYDLKDDAKEFEYLGEDKDKNIRINLSFWVRDLGTNNKFNVRFNITDKKMISEKSGKLQYCNQLGMSTWVDDKKNLADWFLNIKNKDKQVIAETDYRQSYQGEADVYEFMRNWLTKVNWFAATTNVLLDIKKLFRGNVDELKSLITAPEDENLTGSVVMLATVYIKDGDAENDKKMYQNVATKAFMPGYRMKAVRLSCTTNSWDSDKNTKRFKDQILDPEYGVKEAFTFDLLKEFDENDHLNATDAVIKKHDDTVAPTDTEW